MKKKHGHGHAKRAAKKRSNPNPNPNPRGVARVPIANPPGGSMATKKNPKKHGTKKHAKKHAKKRNPSSPKANARSRALAHHHRRRRRARRNPGIAGELAASAAGGLAIAGLEIGQERLPTNLSPKVSAALGTAAGVAVAVGLGFISPHARAGAVGAAAAKAVRDIRLVLLTSPAPAKTTGTGTKGYYGDGYSDGMGRAAAAAPTARMAAPLPQRRLGMGTIERPAAYSQRTPAFVTGQRPG